MGTTSVLAEHYKAVGREEKAAAIRTWLNAVQDGLRKDRVALVQTPGITEEGLNDLAELRGGISIITVLLDRMNEASDAAPATAPEHGMPTTAPEHGL